MSFAEIKTDLSYWQKQTKPLFADLAWNIPEQKSGNVVIVGGNSQSFSTPIRISEFMQRTFSFAKLTTILPDSLRGKVPNLPNVELLPATESGSFAKSEQLNIMFERADATLLIGDLSKNSATAVAIATAVRQAPSQKPLIITRDSVDLLASEATNWLERRQTFIIASMAQLQKLFRSIYYPRMILLSQPLIPVIETLHKFTLTYPVTILTFHQDSIIVASNGKITTTPIVNTDYSPISLWSGQLAGKVLALNLYNPGHELEATTSAVLFK